MTRLKKGPLPSPDDAAEKIADYLRSLEIVIPEARPIGFGHDGAELDEDAVAAMTDEERDEFDGLIFTPDKPDIDWLAYLLVGMGRERPDVFPHRWSWRRWRLTRWVASTLYTTGLSSSGGSILMAGDDPVGSSIYALPRLSSFSPKIARPYVLGRYQDGSRGY